MVGGGWYENRMREARGLMGFVIVRKKERGKKKVVSEKNREMGRWGEMEMERENINPNVEAISEWGQEKRVMMVFQSNVNEMRGDGE